MATKPDRWYFSREQLRNSPSAKCGVDPEKELSYRQQAANLIQDMGQRLQVFQLCINTAIVYMHRFYMLHSFTKFPRNSIAAASLFLAAKVEEQPHKLEHVIRVAHACLHRGEPALDPRSNGYAQQAQELVINESIILQTLGFEVGVVHPHTHVVKCTQMIRASKDLSQSSYFLATNSLHLTTFSLKYKPTVVACVCIHLACKWTQWTIPKSNDGKGWWEYVDQSVTEDLLDELTREFLSIIDRCPTRLKKRIMGYSKVVAAKDSKRLKTEGQSNSEGTSSQAGGSSQVDGRGASSSAVAYDFAFESKPASGFDQYSDSEDSKSEEPSSQKSDKASKDKSSTSASSQDQSRKPETVKLSIEEYKRTKEKERKEKDMLMKRQKQSSISQSGKGESGSLVTGRSVPKDMQHAHKLLPGSVDKNVSVSKERGHERLSSGQERVHPSHERPHTGHDRIHPSLDKLLAGSSRTAPGRDKVPSGHTRGPSGPERLPPGVERSHAGLEKPSSIPARESSSHPKPSGHEKIPSTSGMRPHDKVATATAEYAKHSASIKQKDKKRPEMPQGIVPSSSSRAGSVMPGERIVPSGSRDIPRKDHAHRSYAQALKGAERGGKEQGKPRIELQQHPSKVPKLPHTHRAPEEQLPTREPIPQDVAKEPEHVTQETLNMFDQITSEIMKDLQKESTSSSPISPIPSIVPDKTKVEVKPAPQVARDPVPVASAPPPPLDRPLITMEKDDIEDTLLAEMLDESIDTHQRRRDEKREEKERRRQEHKSRREDKKHRSHKHHRHRSPSAMPSQLLDNDVDDGSGDMAPSKKVKLEQAGSPHTVLTTSKGIKLKIKGLSTPINNGSDHKEAEKPTKANCESPGSLSLKLNLKLNSSSPRESSKEREGGNHHHHRHHHKHKSRHHRSKEGHHKHTHSPGLSSASDASPALSPSKKRALDAIDVTKSLHHGSASLLDLPMPPEMLKASHGHAPLTVKHGKRKRESNPPLPVDDVPPPPPPPDPSLFSSLSELSTINPADLFGTSFHPPVMGGRHHDRKRPAPPSVHSHQKHPP